MSGRLRGLRDAALFHLLGLLPVAACSAIGARLGVLAGRRMPVRSARARRNLAILRPDIVDPAEIERVLTKRWANMGRFVSEFAVLGRLARTAVAGRERLDAVLAAGRPVVFVSLHIGNWELLATVLMGMTRTRALAIYEPPADAAQHRLIVRARRGYADRTLPPVAGTTRRILRHLDGPGHASLLIFVDELRERQIDVPSFGRMLPAKGNLAMAVRLARTTDAVLLPIWLRRVGGARFALEAGGIIEPRDGAAAALDAELGRAAGENADQWLPLHDLRWPERS